MASMKVEKTSPLRRRASKELKTMIMLVWGISKGKGTGGGAERLRGWLVRCSAIGVEPKGRAWS